MFIKNLEQQQLQQQQQQQNPFSKSFNEVLSSTRNRQSTNAFSTSRTVRTEHLVYDWTSLSGDVGGMMGLLLGLSVLAIYDGALELGGHASSSWNKKGGDRRSETSVQDGRNVE